MKTTRVINLVDEKTLKPQSSSTSKPRDYTTPDPLKLELGPSPTEGSPSSVPGFHLPKETTGDDQKSNGNHKFGNSSDIELPTSTKPSVLTIGPNNTLETTQRPRGPISKIPKETQPSTEGGATTPAPVLNSGQKTTPAVEHGGPASFSSPKGPGYKSPLESSTSSPIIGSSHQRKHKLKHGSHGETRKSQSSSPSPPTTKATNKPTYSPLGPSTTTAGPIAGKTSNIETTFTTLRPSNAPETTPLPSGTISKNPKETQLSTKGGASTPAPILSSGQITTPGVLSGGPASSSSPTGPGSKSPVVSSTAAPNLGLERGTKPDTSKGQKASSPSLTVSGAESPEFSSTPSPVTGSVHETTRVINFGLDEKTPKPQSLSTSKHRDYTTPGPIKSELGPSPSQESPSSVPGINLPKETTGDDQKSNGNHKFGNSSDIELPTSKKPSVTTTGPSKAPETTPLRSGPISKTPKETQPSLEGGATTPAAILNSGQKTTPAVEHGGPASFSNPKTPGYKSPLESIPQYSKVQLQEKQVNIEYNFHKPSRPSNAPETTPLPSGPISKTPKETQPSTKGGASTPAPILSSGQITTPGVLSGGPASSSSPTGPGSKSPVVSSTAAPNLGSERGTKPDTSKGQKASSPSPTGSGAKSPEISSTPSPLTGSVHETTRVINFGLDEKTPKPQSSSTSKPRDSTTPGALKSELGPSPYEESPSSVPGINLPKETTGEDQKSNGVHKSGTSSDVELPTSKKPSVTTLGPSNAPETTPLPSGSISKTPKETQPSTKGGASTPAPILSSGQITTPGVLRGGPASSSSPPGPGSKSPVVSSTAAPNLGSERGTKPDTSKGQKASSPNPTGSGAKSPEISSTPSPLTGSVQETTRVINFGSDEKTPKSQSSSTSKPRDSTTPGPIKSELGPSPSEGSPSSFSLPKETTGEDQTLNGVHFENTKDQIKPTLIEPTDKVESTNHDTSSSLSAKMNKISTEKNRSLKCSCRFSNNDRSDVNLSNFSLPLKDVLSEAPEIELNIDRIDAEENAEEIVYRRTAPSFNLEDFENLFLLTLKDGSERIKQLTKALLKTKGHHSQNSLKLEHFVKKLSEIFGGMRYNNENLTYSELYVQLLTETLIAALEIIRETDSSCLTAPSAPSQLPQYINALYNILI
ncbi:hypothetical protein JTE90_011519 [Oedothorax gibbosus]|uniref:Uncharacterized protein n=1 Tax=Oedothorax gibbosus TaxID=931172 RepID=A0AAV6UL57_9ARAC|nr:hypothetical protein JTE90_011519 [Oedothorax gibbosus]